MPFYHPFGGRDSTKADKTTPATNHNLAGLTTAGNLEDSTITPATAASQFTLVGGTGTPRTLTVDGDLTASTVNTAVGKAHDRSHAITSTDDHTSTATAGQMLKGDANGLPVDATNTDAEVSGAVSASHTQNTDTGTTSTTWQIDSGNSGPKLKNSSGVVEVRNAADDAYADTKAKDAVFETVNAGIKTVTQASTDTLTADECRGTVISNYGQGAENTQTLPTAAAGLNGIVVIGTAGAGAFHLKAGPDDKIYLDGTALNDADKVSIATPAVGDYLTFFSFQTGADAYDWIVQTGHGTLTDGGA